MPDRRGVSATFCRSLVDLLAPPPGALRSTMVTWAEADVSIRFGAALRSVGGGALLLAAA
jgi:hypothetical protein